MSAYANQTYRNRSVAAASPADQVAMLLETAARHMMTALNALDAKDYEARFLATEKAQLIIKGLQQCLAEDVDEAKQMVEVFDNYYTNLSLMITRVNVRNDRDACSVVVDGLRTMAQTWRQVGQSVPHAGAPAPQQSGTAAPGEQPVTMPAGGFTVSA
ncbi:flagellar export chaperone FliS [Radicibacter daui]|uniref:flagellar export chaperone FliS n=1 Tax=Radicibacter daui TaxID=3064829 RepID=UPI004046EA06